MKIIQKSSGLPYAAMRISVYILLSLLTFCNQLLWKHEMLATALRVIIYVMLYYKSIKMLYIYNKAAKKEYPSAIKSEFNERYKGYRTQIILWWTGMAVVCGAVKFVWDLDYNYYFSLAFLLLAVDLIFVHSICLLQVFSDPKAKVVKCCCGCPIRGWDLVMVNTPFLFAYNTDNVGENLLTLIAIILSIFTFVYWERYKYFLVEVRRKCDNFCDLKICIENRKNNIKH